MLWRPGLSAEKVAREQAAIVRVTTEVYDHMEATRARCPEPEWPS